MGIRNQTVQIGRVALVNYGADAGKLVIILDIVDEQRALVTGTNDKSLSRQTIVIRNLSLTKLTANITRGMKCKKARAICTKANIDADFAKSSWAQKLSRSAKRANLNDFDRFKVMLLRKKRSAIIKAALKK